MGFHDRTEDEKYSEKLRMRATPHPYVRELAQGNPVLAASLANFNSGPAKPHRRYRKLTIPSQDGLAVGATVLCVKNTRADWTPANLILVTPDCKLVAPVPPADAGDLSTEVAGRGAIEGRVKSTNAQGHAEILLELKE